MLATTSRDVNSAEPRINRPVYSPDGKTVLLTEDYQSGAAVTYYGTVGDAGTVVTDVSVIPVVPTELTYLVSADAGTLMLPPASYDSSTVRPLFGLTNQGKPSPIRVNPLQKLFWLPGDNTAEEHIGAMPPENGQINRGISGALHGTFSDKRGSRTLLRRFDLATNTATDTPIIWTESAGQEFDENAGKVAVSPDSSLYAIYKNDSKDENGRIVFIQNDGTITSTLTLRTDEFDLRPSFDIAINDLHHFSPDGRYLAWPFARNKFDENYGTDPTGIAVLDIANKSIISLVGRAWNATGWTPDGKLLMIDGGEVNAVELTGNVVGAETQLLNIKDDISYLSFSPDSSRMVFVAGDNSVLTAASDGSNVTRVFERSSTRYSQPGWSPDGRYILTKCLTPEVRKYADVCVAAADARNLRHSPGSSSPGVLVVSSEETQNTSFFYSGPVWR